MVAMSTPTHILRFRCSTFLGLPDLQVFKPNCLFASQRIFSVIPRLCPAFFLSGVPGDESQTYLHLWFWAAGWVMWIEPLGKSSPVRLGGRCQRLPLDTSRENLREEDWRGGRERRVGGREGGREGEEGRERGKGERKERGKKGRGLH